MGRRRVLCLDARYPGQDGHALGRLPEERRSVRCGVLQDFSQRSDEDGSAAEASARTRLGGAGGRRSGSEGARGNGHRRVHRAFVERLRPRAGGSERERCVHADGKRRQHRRQPAVLLLRFSGPELHRRHRMLLGARGAAPGMPQHLEWRIQPGAGRRGQHHLVAHQHDQLQPGGRACSGDSFHE